MNNLFKKKEKKPKKKLTQNQLINRISYVVFAVMIVVMLIIVVPQSIEDIKDSTVGQFDILDDLCVECEISDITNQTITNNDMAELKTKLENAGINIFDGEHISLDKYNEISSCDSFSLTANELMCFVNELLSITPNYYSTTFYYAELTTDTSTKLLCVARLNFRSLCRFGDSQIQMYNSLNYTVPNKVYLTTLTDISDTVSSSVTFNALDTKKSNSAKAFIESNRTNFVVENVLYDTIKSALNTFCEKVDMTFDFTQNTIFFTNK